MKTIRRSVTVTYLLISKTGSSESLSELSSMAESTRVQAECQRYRNASVDLYFEHFQYRAPLWGNRVNKLLFRNNKRNVDGSCI